MTSTITRIKYDSNGSLNSTNNEALKLAIHCVMSCGFHEPTGIKIVPKYTSFIRFKQLLIYSLFSRYTVEANREKKDPNLKS